MLPAEWHSQTEAWASYHPDTWNETDWRQSCGTCHITGLDTESWEFTEFGIGCESCHGPAEDHVADPENIKPFAATDDQVCGACHSRGTSPDGFAFPATFRPGDQLTDHFTFTTDPADSWPDGSAKLHNQQYLDWTMGNSMEADDSTSCASCHAVHGGGVGRAQLKAPVNELCVECHGDKRALITHMPYHEVASAEHDFTCTDCHMPKMATSAVDYDITATLSCSPTHKAVSIMVAWKQCRTHVTSVTQILARVRIGQSKLSIIQLTRQEGSRSSLVPDRPQQHHLLRRRCRPSDSL